MLWHEETRQLAQLTCICCLLVCHDVTRIFFEERGLEYKKEGNGYHAVQAIFYKGGYVR